MKKTILMSLLVVAVAMSASFPAAAGGRHHGHGRSNFGFYFGGPVYDPFWGPSPFFRPYPYYYEPRTVIIEREPPVYVQRQTAPLAPVAPAPAAPTVWYYCQSPAGYYPYVQNCNQQWVSVDPRSIAPPAPR